MSKQLEFIHFAVDFADMDIDHSGCFYEGDTPEVILENVELRQVKLSEVLVGMSNAQLKALGLQRLEKRKK